MNLNPIFVFYIMNDNIIGKRLEIFIDSLHISQNEFAKSIGLSSGLISYITSGKTNFGVNKLTKIKEKYPDLNIEWLISGNGSMIKSKKEFDKNLVELLSSKGIEILDVDTKKKAADSYLYLPFKDLVTGEVKCYKVSTDDLAPFLFNGDYVIAEKDKNWKYSLYENRLCVIVTEENYIIGRTINIDAIISRGYLTIETNQNNYEINVDTIKSVWNVKSKITYNVNHNVLPAIIKNKSTELSKSDSKKDVANYLGNLFSISNNSKPVVLYFGIISEEIKLILLRDLKKFIVTEELNSKKSKSLFSKSADCLEVKQLPNLSDYMPSTFFSIQKTEAHYKIIMGKMLRKVISKKIKNNLSLKENLSLVQKAIYESDEMLPEDEVILALLKLISKNKENTQYEFVEYNEGFDLFFIKIQI